MVDITDNVSRYREAARHLWNATFRVGSVDWDARDRFSRVASELFDALVLEPAGVTEQRLPDMFEAEPGHLHRIAVLPTPEQIPILINREMRSHGYWDDPVNVLRRDEADIRLSRFFDWDELGPRDFQFALVQIMEWSANQHLKGRYALVDCAQVRFILLSNGAA